MGTLPSWEQVQLFAQSTHFTETPLETPSASGIAVAQLTEPAEMEVKLRRRKSPLKLDRCPLGPAYVLVCEFTLLYD